jgi:uncharacterized protein YndB with AHSA1/START domain
MSTVHVKVDIDAPPQDVWDLVMDPDRFKDWVTIHRSVSSVSERPFRRGATMDQVMHMRGLTFRVHWTLTDVSEPTRAEWEGRGPAHSRARIKYELSGADGGPTSFEYTNELTPPGGSLGNVASRFIIGTASEREANRSLERLKSLLEHR